MMKTARNLDVAIVVSGDGDFAPAIRAVQEMGVRCEVISFRGNTSSDLIEVADLFTDITQIAKVEKGSSRSGRRVADDDEDLSMTEVPDKQTEGTGIGRGRVRAPAGAGPGSASRSQWLPRRAPPGRVRPPAVAVDRPSPSPWRRPTRDRRPPPWALPRRASAALVALPGEKLSKSAIAAAAVVIPPTVAPLDADLEPDVDDEDAPEVSPVDGEGETEEGQRRRRRRGGRGRGRGRGRAEGEPAAGTGTPPREIVARPPAVDEEDEEDLPVAPRPPARRPSARSGTARSGWTGRPRRACRRSMSTTRTSRRSRST